MRINAKGLHWTPVTLADGTKKTYWYAWRGGPRLIGEHGSPEFKKAGIGTALNRCRALATKIANELRNKRPEQFVDKLSLADVHASLERAANVLSTVKGSQAGGRQRHR